MKVALLLMTVCLLPSLCFGATIYVPDDHATIQEAIDAAVDGDTVLVRAGIYVECIDFKGKAITVESVSGPDVTVIDGGRINHVVTFDTAETNSSVLSGFTVTNEALDHSGIRFGRYASPVISDNIITRIAPHSWEAAVYCNEDSSALIINNEICNNSGVGIKQSDYDESNLVIAGNLIRNNTYGIHCSGNGDLKDEWWVTITGNEIRDNSDDAIYSWRAYLTISDNVIQGNGCCGIALTWGSTEISGNIISGNVNDGVSSFENGRITLSNNIISGNGKHGFSHDSFTVKVINNTITDNSGDGIHMTGASTTNITNTINWGNAGSSLYFYHGEPTVTYSNIEGGWPGTGNIDADPLFVDAAASDYHIPFTSPCRNAGSNDGVPPELLYDWEGDPRIHHGTVDIGADEFHLHHYITGTAAPGRPIDVKVVGDPFTWPVTLGVSSGRLDPPLSTAYGNFYLESPLLTIYRLGTVPDTGVLVFPATVPLFWNPGESYHTQVMAGFELTNPAVIEVE